MTSSLITSLSNLSIELRQGQTKNAVLKCITRGFKILLKPYFDVFNLLSCEYKLIHS